MFKNFDIIDKTTNQMTDFDTIKTSLYIWHRSLFVFVFAKYEREKRPTNNLGSFFTHLLILKYRKNLFFLKY